MSRKSGKKGGQTPSRQQQQQDAAARRRALGTAVASRQRSAPAADTPGPATVVRAGDGGAPGLVRYYLDVSAVRIQAWLARTPDLKFRRGASILLSHVTGRDAWPDARLPAGTVWNDEAGDLDGVVSLAVDPAVPGPEVAGVLASAARKVAADLRTALPHCPIQALVGSGATYADAYLEIERARADGEFLIDSPPAPTEAVLAKPCDQCRDAPAQHRDVEIVGVSEREDLCAECLARLEAAGGTKGDWQPGSPRPERRLKEALARAGMPVRGFPDDFQGLAQAGRQARDDAATQIALIYADGNRVGAFLSRAADHSRRHRALDKAGIVRAVDTATLAALTDAVAGCFASSPRPPVLAHLAGGDDLMVSVPAGAAWPFARVLLAAFGSRLASAGDWPGPIRADLPSLSAGIVFHHFKAPFADVVRLAKGCLDWAKQETQGKEPSVAFLDLTADGGEPPESRAAVTLAGLDGWASLLAQIARIPRAHRQTLVALHRLSTEQSGSGPSPGRAETPAETLARRVVDLGYQPLWEVVAGRGAQPPAVREKLVSDPAARDKLRRALDLARWWPPGQDEPAAPRGVARGRQGVPA